MLKIAIVEDNEDDAGRLISCLEKFKSDMNENFICERFADGDSFLKAKKAYDIVFMDIMLPVLTGMEVATRMRRYNTESILIFVTNMVQFAVKSYDVDAFDYILKPITYERVKLKLKKAVDSINSKKGTYIVVNNADGIAQISTRQIYYIEVRGHTLMYHTDSGILQERGSLSDLEEQLVPYDFMRCNACYLVNPNYIAAVNGLIITLFNGEELKISQPKRKSFMDMFTTWLGQKRS